MSLYRLPSNTASLDVWSELGEKEWTMPAKKKDVEAALREALVELYKKEMEIDELKSDGYYSRQCY